MESNLQIISGKYSGRKLTRPANARPTQNRARTAVFNMINSVFNGTVPAGLTIWDAFAGSGAFGLEFISRRWAAHVILTDLDSGAIKSIRKNSENMTGQIDILQADSMSVIDKFAHIVDVVFVDPPYDNYDIGKKFIERFVKNAKPGAIIIWEIDTKTCPDAEMNMGDIAKIIKDKTYGRARFVLFKV